MPVSVQNPTAEQIRELRNRFVQKYEQSPPAELFHPADIARVKDDDLWCRRFLEMYDLDMQVAFDKLWDTCIWRQQYGTNDLTEANLRAEYLNDGVVFARNRDVNGKPLLIFKTKLHVKGSKDMDEVMRVVVYWIERIRRETNMDQLTIFFDMAGCGLTSMDMDFVKRIIDTFKSYYPNALNYILIYEMAWVLNAVFKIIKGLLPAKALEILKMITKKDITTYIDKDNCLDCWGGNDNYEFKFVPEKVRKPSTLALKANGHAKPTNGSLPMTANVRQQQPTANSPDKKVHFANSSPVEVPKMLDVDEEYTPPSHDMLRIYPKEFIAFFRGENQESSESTVDITCTADATITYKIQTTSPEKFRVRPRCGVLHAGECVSVSILLKQGCQLASGSKDKFLVMCMPLPPGMDTSSQQIVEYWKQKPTNSPDVEQHRLCCIYKNVDETRNGFAGDEDHSEFKSATNISELSKYANKLEKQLRLTQILQFLTLVFLLILCGTVLYLLRTHSSCGVEDEVVVAHGKAVADGCPFGKRL